MSDIIVEFSPQREIIVECTQNNIVIEFVNYTFQAGWDLSSLDYDYSMMIDNIIYS